MQCARWREALSAAADGEEIGMEPRLLRAHVARCPGCAAFERSLRRTGPTASLRIATPASATADATVEAAVRAVGRWDRGRITAAARWGLVIVAVQIAVLSVPELWGSAQGSTVHSARHLGAFTVAYAVGLLVVAWRPARARTMLPVAGVLAVALAITTVIDLFLDHIPLLDETAHLPEVVSLGLLWLIRAQTLRVGDAAEQPASAPPTLRAVPPEGGRSADVG